jgi:hypothetical protein
MKNKNLIPIITTAIVFLYGCNTNITTSVRVKELTFINESNEIPTIKPTITEQALRKNAGDLDEVFFPGDTLKYTIEIEDPNYEFVSLIAIRFNGVVIRGNVGDSIISTRDCGNNICVEFPFVLQEGKTTYTLEDLRFARIDSSSAISARIDENSQISIDISFYNETIFPFVGETIDKLNYLSQNATYLSSNNDYEENYLHEFYHYGFSYEDTWIGTRQLVLFNYQLNDPIERNFGSFQSKLSNQDMYYERTNHIKLIQKQYGAYTVDGFINRSSIVLEYHLILDVYQNTVFYNDGNDIYVTVADVNYLLFTMQNRSRFFSVLELDELPPIS